MTVKKTHLFLKVDKEMAKSSTGARIRICLEHCCELGSYRYTTTKNRRNTMRKLVLRKYSPITNKHEMFTEIK